MKIKYDPRIHHRHSIRLKGYDYSQEGMYFITIVTQGSLSVFGEVVTGEMRLNRSGEIVQKWWGTIEDHFPNVKTEIFIIMPNHVHGIIHIDNNRKGTVSVPEGYHGYDRGESTSPLRRKPTLGQIVAFFKYQTTKEINMMKGGQVTKLWQRNYYDHIIRNQEDLELTWLYIESNPDRWETDEKALLNGKTDFIPWSC
jgi:putative transposase